MGIISYSSENLKDNTIFYDGFCHLCDGTIALLYRLDSKKIFQYTPLQSDLGEKIKKEIGGNDSIVFYKEKKLYFLSDAVLTILENTKSFSWLGKLGKIVPLAIRDFFYRFVAKYRYKVFGKRTTCSIPPNQR